MGGSRAGVILVMFGKLRSVWRKHTRRMLLFAGAGMFFVGGVLFYRCLPEPLFDVSYSTVLEDRSGRLLAARTANDEQWRFPPGAEMSDKYITSLLLFEDRRFYSHPGVDPFALARAIRQNMTSDQVVSGASTLSMQVVRLAGGNPPRTYSRKLLEMIQALRLERRYSKAEILDLYAAHAPFGGNVVGIEAASWRYFGHPPDELSWAEAAMLAVLPNSPSLIHPGRNRATLKAKRDALLDRLHLAGHLDAIALSLAKQEAVPEIPHTLPQHAPHLLDRVYTGRNRGTQLRTTIDYGLQERALDVVERHYGMLRMNEIHNAAAIITDVRTGEVLVYIGNTPGPTHLRQRGHMVDIVQAPRSTGSILKPILYTLMMQDGSILPQTLVADIPTQISEYTPQNFSRSYMGAVPASEVVSRSLNVPSVRMLQKFGLSRFYYYLQEMGMTTLNRPPEHYGLTLILGGAEGTLWDITGMYTSLAYHLRQNQSARGARYQPRTIRFTSGESGNTEVGPDEGSGFLLGPGTVWAMMEAMREVTRPEGEVDWRRFASARQIAWKTGTSYGNRDAWAVGMTPEYVVGVWVGNASGEGRSDLTGVHKAAPIMFDLFNLLGTTTWFSEPTRDTYPVAICLRSGHRAGTECEETEYRLIPIAGLETEACPYHHRIHITRSDPPRRVDSRCEEIENMRTTSHFTLPPSMAHYYRQMHPGYRSLPIWKEGCTTEPESIQTIALIYPPEGAEIYVPIELDGTRGMTVFEAAHDRPATRIFWHLNDSFLGSTTGIHQMSAAPDPGWYTLTLVDEEGHRLERRIRILGR